MWPPEFSRFWRGGASCRTVSEQYSHGRVVLGLNNQRSGMDGIRNTVMTSMRTFEALACAKPFLSAGSDAYNLLGLRNGTHLIWVEDRSLTQPSLERLLGEEGTQIGQAGHDFVLSEHTYKHRLERVAMQVIT